jgi:signal peptidase I
VVATLIMGGVTVASLLGFRIMIVTSGSMVPTFRPADAVVIRPGGVASVRPGNIITFRAPGAHGMTTHRVLSVRIINGTRWFQTKGDANPSSDPNLVPADAVYGRHIMTLPGMGRFLYLALTPRGKLAILGLPIAFLAAQELGVLLRARRRRYTHHETEQDGGDFEPAPAPETTTPSAVPQPEPGTLQESVPLDAIEPEPADRYERVEAELRSESARLAAAEAALAELERKLTELQSDNRHVHLSQEIPAAEHELELEVALSA